MKSIVLFTRFFPYNISSESFILKELEVVAKDYSITLVPFSRRGGVYHKIPSNVMVNNSLCDIAKKQKIVCGIKMLLSFYFWNAIFSSDFIVSCKTISDKIYYLKILYGAQSVKHVIENRKIDFDDDTVFYSYWLTFAPLGLALLKYKGKIKNRIISRTHGYEIYEKDVNNHGIYPHFPLRNFTYKWVDNIYSISQKCVDILSLNYPSYISKYKISHLGVSPFSKKQNVNSREISILSCSYLYSLKRVPLIFSSLHNFCKNNPNILINWYHIGSSRNDGYKGFYDLKEFAVPSVSNFKVELLGEMTNSEVISFYNNNSLDIFVNLSTTEGIPVSIMEAMSAGLAILATDVGSNSEIVASNVGRLVDVNFNQIEFDKALMDIINNKLQMSIESINAYKKYWCAETNYTEFYKNIASKV